MINNSIIINNRNNILLNDIPVYHPDSRNYHIFWMEQLRRIIEGFWFPDDENVSIDVKNFRWQDNLSISSKWRFCPPKLYFYANFGTILHKELDAPKSAPKKRMRPHVDDLEWVIAYDLLIVDGFSGFELDELYTSNEDLPDKLKVESEYHGSCFNSKDKLKVFTHGRNYVDRLFEKPLGNCIYQNSTYNYMLMGSGGLGKSFFIAQAVVGHELITDGRKSFNIDEDLPVSHQFVGSGMSSKSAEFMRKVKMLMDYFPGEYKFAANNIEPAPFYKGMMGSIKENSIWTHSYKKKLSGKWEDFIGSSITHIPFTAQNLEAAAGGRYRYIVVEECGLCFSPDTDIRMADMSIKKIKDINLGEYVMGHTGIPNKVVQVKWGIEEMYKVEQKFGDTYIVSKNHIMYLNKKFKHYKTNTVNPFTCFVQDFIPEKLGTHAIKETYGIANDCLEFNRKVNLKLDPYYLGIWLGNGTKNVPEITIHNNSKEIADYLYKYAKEMDMRVVKTFNSKNCYRYSIRLKTKDNFTIGKGEKLKQNYIIKCLKEYGINDNKRIPLDYQFASKKDRLELLSGLLDTDGCLVKKKTGECFEFYQTNREDLIEDVRLLAKNLGFRVRIKQIKSNIGFDNKILDEYRIKYTLRISGDIHEIPTKVLRKKAPYRQYLKHINSTSISVTSIGKGIYCGIVLETPLFLLKDGTIVHNTKSLLTIHGSNTAAQQHDTYSMGSSLYLGTGGNIEKSIEAEIMFRDPDAYRLLSFEDIYEGGGRMARFIPALYKDREFKDKNGNTDLVKAENYYKSRREEKSKAKNPTALYLEKMNYPLVPSEMFLTQGGDFFPVIDLQDVLSKLSVNTIVLASSWKREMKIEDGIITPAITNKPVIIEFPLPEKSNTDACIEIYEMPKTLSDGRIPNGRYIAGIDSVDKDGKERQFSLQSCLVLDTWTDKIVADYTARPILKKDYWEQCRRLLIFYNAVAMYESNLKGIFAYFENKQSLYYLAKTPTFIREKEITKVDLIGDSAYGIRMNNFLMTWADDAIKDWLLSKNPTAKNEELNLHYIRSIGLLKELIKFRPDINADRLSALRVCILYRESILSRIDSDRLKKDRYLNKLTNDKFFDKSWRGNYKFISPKINMPESTVL